MSQRFTIQQVAEFTVRLRADLPPGSTVSTQVLHVSRSGMQREIAAYIIRDGEIVNISWEVAAIIGARYGDRGGVILSGVGMDMTHHLVYSLSRRLYPNGFLCTGSDGYTPTGKRSKVLRCPSNDHVNDYGRLSREYEALPWSIEDKSGHRRHEGANGYPSHRRTWIAAQRPKLYSRKRLHHNGGYAVERVNL